MEQEWSRDDEWVDWRGKQYSGWREWLYVVSPVPSSAAPRKPLPGSTVAGSSFHGCSRDEGNAGMTVDDFVRTTNDYILDEIRKIRDKLEKAGITTDDSKGGGRGSSHRSVRGNSLSDFTPQEQRDRLLLLIENEHLLLNREEAIAIRLYTGPAYQPLNTFLRELAKVGKDWRVKLAKNRALSYSSTCKFLVDGLRKLVRVNRFVAKHAHKTHCIQHAARSTQHAARST
jgi:hypothetical protein